MDLILHICRLGIYSNEKTEQPRALCDSCNSIFSLMFNVLQCYVMCNVWYLQTLLKVLAQFFILLGIISVDLQFYVYVLLIVVCPFVLFLLAIVFLFFDLRILITPLISSYCSCLKYIQILKYQIVSTDSMKIWKVVGETVWACLER